MIETELRPEQPARLIDKLSDDAYNRFLEQDTVLERVALGGDGGTVGIAVPNTLSRAVRSTLENTGRRLEHVAAELAAQTIYTPEDATFLAANRYDDWDNLFAHIANSILYHETVRKYPEAVDLDAIRQGIG